MKLSNSLFLDRETRYDIKHKINYLKEEDSKKIILEATNDSYLYSDIQKKLIINSTNDINKPSYYKLLDDNSENE